MTLKKKKMESQEYRMKWGGWGGETQPIWFLNKIPLYDLGLYFKIFGGTFIYVAS